MYFLEPAVLYLEDPALLRVFLVLKYGGIGTYVVLDDLHLSVHEVARLQLGLIFGFLVFVPFLEVT